MTGRQLRDALRLLEYKQSDLAAEVKKSQKAVSLWVTGTASVPEEVEKRVRALIAEKFRDRPDVLRQIDQSPIESNVHSWPQETFDLLWKDADKRKRVRQIEMAATIRPGPTEFATCDIRMDFHELEFGPHERLYLDHLAVRLPRSEWSADAPSQWDTPRLEAQRAQISIDKDIADPDKGIGPHAIAYELSNADRHDHVTVALHADRAVRLDDFDAIGFPLYGDLLVERLLVNVHFEGLDPEPSPPIAQTYLIRRTTWRPSGLVSDLEPPLCDRKSDGLHCTFGPLLRPRNGYVYCLSWAKLKRRDTTGDTKTP